LIEEPQEGPQPEAPGKIRRPVLVWIIVLWVIYSVLSSFYTLAMGLGGKLEGPPELTAIYREHPTTMVAYAAISAMLQGGGALFLFHLKRLALWFFLGNVFFSLYLSFQRMEALKATGIPGELLAIVVLTGLGIQLAVCGYIWMLDRRGYLG
jgi:hypothetical protein